MKQVESRSWGNTVGVLVMFGAGIAGCIDTRGDDVPTWESYLAAATVEFEGQPTYFVDGDIAVTFDELGKSYDHLVAQRANEGAGLGTATSDSVVNVVVSTGYFPGGKWGGIWYPIRKDDIWASDQARDITYCVSNEFGDRKARAVSEMGTATRDWEQHANIKFRHVSEEDAACTNGNFNVKFAVRPWTENRACAPFPSSSRTEVCGALMMNLEKFGLASLGIFRHELGHVLGLQHEHIRSPAEECREGEGGLWRAVTEYDVSSVMHYPCGPAKGKSNLVITELDAAGIQALYGPPPPPPSPAFPWWWRWWW